MSLKLKIKINNSYESESGCGSSISGNNDYSSIYDDDQLDYIIKPPSYSNEVTITTTQTMAPVTSLNANDSILSSVSSSSSSSSASSSSSSQTSKDSVLNSKESKRDMLFGIPLHSSQESAFEGFGNSPFDKLQRIFYPQQQSSLLAPNVVVASAADSGESKSQMAPRKPSPGKIVFTKFYDTIVEENSCNAVDIQMSSNDQPALPLRRTSSSSSISNQTADANPSSELSFNGKIKSLSKQDESTTLDVSLEAHSRLPPVLETSLNTSQQQFSESFILKKYSNEKSPDLFGDDDDEEEEEAIVEEEEETKGCGVALKTITEDPTAIDTHKISTTCLNETTENQSFSCPVDGSFANDDYTMDCSLTQASVGLGGGPNGPTDSYSLFKENCRREREMLRRIRKCLAGVLPPPSVTIPQLDMFNAVLSRKDELMNFFKQLSPQKTEQQPNTQKVTSLFKPTHTLEEAKTMPWRDILGVRQHGLSYNLNKASENNEYLSLSIMERFIGAETASSYQNSPSSAKKRSTRMKLLCQSPGNRLSHLAKRRAIFSSAHLATTSQKSSTLLGPQIVLDKKKPKNRRKATPKRMTPGSKKKNRKTPSSSARKRLYRNDIIKPGPSRETSKRALFQSPAKHVQQRASLPKPPPMKPELANRVEKSKRALLFTPEKQQEQTDHKFITTTETNSSITTNTTHFAPYNSSQLESLLKRKRNPCDDADDVDIAMQNSKLMKTGSSGLTPRALKIKSQSFCIGAGSSSAKQQLPSASAASRGMTTNASCSSISSSSSHSLARASSITSLGGSKLQKSYSETTASSNSLTENQKKKLLWAVSQALQERKITAKHESFKQYAATLARVVRRIFQEYYQKNSTSNSETMLRLAKKYVYNVTAGGTADDIYLQAKSQIDDTKRQSTSRLSGYIGPEEYQQMKKQQLTQQSSQSLLQASLSSSSFSHKVSSLNIFNGDSSFDSFGPISQNTSGFCSGNNTAMLSQTNSFLGQISQDIIIETSQSSNTRSGKKLMVDPNKSLPNSSSKSNIYADALRENMDCDVRNSAQKNFTGKDQRNMIPYAGNGGNGGSAVKAHTQLVTDIITNSAKARRQITFDT
ncbi:serine-rich adhesin for platelets [Musca vetustissima]|uniref:serine-rich adhesin for platelets n=1 Tax=Musca vetustissima TaxID=27455 RepID=UPI002AB7AE61|nr:serine-rich adhesin for platelets [Musca vetustissima]